MYVQASLNCQQSVVRCYGVSGRLQESSREETIVAVVQNLNFNVRPCGASSAMFCACHRRDYQSSVYSGSVSTSDGLSSRRMESRVTGSNFEPCS